MWPVGGGVQQPREGVTQRGARALQQGTEGAQQTPQPNELRGLSSLGSWGLGETARITQDMHAAIARRSFGPTTPVSTPVKALHDVISAAVYGSIRGAAAAAGTLASRGAEAVPAHRRRPLTHSRAGRGMLGALNGLIGEELERDGSELTVGMSLHRGERELPPDRSQLADALPQATPKLAIFIHGLCESDTAWAFRAKALGQTYGSRLSDELGYTPLYLRYNTGLHISDNGRRLSELLEQLVAEWPTEVDEIALIGHSVGGLVARSAAHAATTSGAAWVASLRDIVSLSSPHLGSPVEKAANTAAWGLRAFAESAPLARVLTIRSAGIKDLRFGYLVDEDWQGRDPDALWDDNRHDIPLCPTADHYFVTATLTRDPKHPLGRAVGDFWVRPASASGRKDGVQRIPFALDDGYDVGGSGHVGLLNHPRVADQLTAWLGKPSPEPV